MHTEQVLADVDEAIRNAMHGNRISRRVLREGIAVALGDLCCKRCGDVLTEADRLDGDGQIDRKARTVCGKALTARQWGIFKMLYLGERVDRYSLEDHGLLGASRAMDRNHLMRTVMSDLRKRLRGTEFSIVTRLPLHGEGAEYFLQRKSEETAP